MSVQTLDKQWQRFLNLANLKLMSKIQQDDMEFAFKSGAVSVLEQQYLELAKLKEKDGIHWLEYWLEEYKNYVTKNMRQTGVIQ